MLYHIMFAALVDFLFCHSIFCIFCSCVIYHTILYYVLVHDTLFCCIMQHYSVIKIMFDSTLYSTGLIVRSGHA